MQCNDSFFLANAQVFTPVRNLPLAKRGETAYHRAMHQIVSCNGPG